MCKITETKSFQIFGKLHATRGDAIEYGLSTLAVELQKNHSSAIKTGLIEMRKDLAYLLTEHIAAFPEAPPKPEEEVASDEPTTLSTSTTLSARPVEDGMVTLANGDN
jgi:hypothetical protein